MSPPLLVAPNAPSVSQVGAVSVAQPGTVETEVVVVGTGAGGAAAGAELARAGKRVLFLEAGGAYAQPDFQRKKLSWSTAHLYAAHGPQSAQGDAVMVIPQGRVVGGSTVLNEGICFRPPVERLNEWAKAVDAPHLLPDAMAPFVDEIWRRLGVAPVHEGIGRRNNAVMRDGLTRLGLAEHGWITRNAPTCLGCGVCHLGCPSGAKASVDKSLLPEAVNLGARILCRARAQAVIIEGGRARGVEAVVVDPATEEPRGTLKVKADLVIISGSALGTPLVLENSGVQNEHLGEHLALHPGFGVFGEMPDVVNLWDGVPQGYYGHVPGDDRITLEAQGLGPVELYGLLGRAGHPEGALDYKKLVLAGAMIRDRGGGRVRLKKGTTTFRPDISVKLHDEDFDAIRKGAKMLVRTWFAAGAKRVAPTTAPFAFYSDEASAFAAIDRVQSARDMLQVYASHPQGTCRMGVEGEGVVDKNGRALDGLYVMDGSIFPTTLGTNPQITIMSLATMLARRLVT